MSNSTDISAGGLNPSAAVPAPHILIVDDEPFNCKLLETLLQPEGYVTVSVASGEEALTSIAVWPPDLILLDVMMPGMDGHEVARTLKASPATSNIPIILVTAQSDHDARLAGLDTGAEDFLTKPVDRAELWLRVRNLLRLKALGDSLQKHNQMLEQEVQERVADLHLFHKAMDATADGIFLVSRSSMCFVEINGTGCRMFGYTREELFEMGPAQLASMSVKALALIYDALIAGQVSQAFSEVHFQRKDGSSIQVEVRRHVQRSGADWIVVVVIRDITEKKRAERDILNYAAQLKTAFMSTVNLATTLSEMRDPYTAGHERRVGAIASAIGAELGFDTNRQEGLLVAGHLHDIGKIGVPSEILAKPGILSATQRELIQEHAQGGYDVLKDVEFPWPVAWIAHQHHERMDGSGYPQGLRGDAILLEARIMAVADVVESMSSHRPYRAALGLDLALVEIEHGRATVYDALVADACLKLFREKGYAIPA
jgi:PAS domain S-box-containing protein